MAPRTTLGLEEVRELLRAYGLRALGLMPIPRGTINSNYRVDTEAGPLFLRVCEGKTEREVRYEADLLWHLNTAGLPTPALWRTRRGEPFVLLRHSPPGDGPGKPVMLMRWAEGEELSEAAIGAAEAHAVGVLLARLHRTGAGFRQRREGIYTQEHIRARVRRLHLDPRVPDGTVEYLQRELLHLERARRRDLPAGLGHNDLFPDNVFFAPRRWPSRTRQVAWLLDLEQAATLPHAYDLAVALLSFCAAPGAGGPPDAPERLGPFRRPLLQALLAGYQSLRPLSEAERRGLHDEARFAALRFTVTRLTDVHLGPPGLAGAGKDYREFLRRLEALCALPADAFYAALEP